MQKLRRHLVPVLFFVLAVAVSYSYTVGAKADDVAPPWRAIGAIFPRLSDSGEQIAFSYQGAIWRMPRTGGTMIRLTSDKGFDIEPAWSPDGATLAYIQSRDFLSGALQLIRASDGTPIPLPRTVTVRDKLYFSRDGKRLLGNFLDAYQKPTLTWLDLATGEIGAPLFPAQPRQRYTLSHDNQWIVQATFQDLPEEQMGNNGPEVDLWKIPAAGGEAQKIGHFHARIYDLCWAADDKSLLLVSNLGGAHNDIWQMPLDDPTHQRTRKLTFGQADEECPSVSADGRWLLMTDNFHGATGLVVRDLKEGSASWPTVSKLDFGQPSGQLELQLIDDASGLPVTARCSIRHADGKVHCPPESLYRLSAGELHSYIEGKHQWALPAGRYQIRAARGPEYRIATAECEIRPGETTTQTLKLQRWTDQRALGWYSGEAHIHANYGYGHWYNSPRTMRAQCAGEDLVVCNFMVANSDGDGVFDREYFRGRPDSLSTNETILYWNEEFRSTLWGHMTLLNLKQLVEPLFTGFRHTTHPHDHPTNADIGMATHDQEGHVNYTHPAHNVKDPYLSAYSAKELPVDVALGTVDSIDVMGSSHQANMPLWYKLLNCGFHVPASAGTDCFLNRIPSRLPGSDRVYVQVAGDFTYERWIAGLKAGRTFVTNGPVLQFSVNGQQAGGTLRFDGPTSVKVATQIRAEFPLKRIELIYNGAVAAGVDIKEERRDTAFEMAFDREVSVGTSGWLALRVSGSPHPARPQFESFAHTSPVYLEIAGAPLDTKADAEYFLTWIDRLWEAVRLRNRIPGRHTQHVETQINTARAVYRKLAGRGAGGSKP